MEPRGPRRVNDADRIFSYSSITSPMYRNAPATAGGQGPSNANNDSETEDGKNIELLFSGVKNAQTNRRPF